MSANIFFPGHRGRGAKRPKHQRFFSVAEGVAVGKNILSSEWRQFFRKLLEPLTTPQ